MKATGLDDPFPARPDDPDERLAVTQNDGSRLSTPVVELDDVSFGYRAGVRVLEDVSLAVAAGEFVAIAGPNGGGKTTLLRLVLGLERPSEGSVRVFGQAAGKGGDGGRIGYLPQRSRLLGEAPVTVREIVSTGRLAPSGIWGPLRRADRDAVASAIETVGLGDRADAPLRTLSGGMQQRALIAKALASEPTLLALDEPTTGVDAASQESLGLLLETLRADLGVTILYVSHEFGAVEHVVDRIVLVRGGIVYDGPPSGLPGVWHDPSHQHGHGHRRA
jgi:zinc transport system ATP-binding protein